MSADAFPSPVKTRPDWLARLTSHIPPGQFLRYVVVGGWNTLFGYGSFAILTALLQPRLTHGYILAGLLSTVLSITVAFLGYKWFVFRTKGNYLREWLRCVSVYSSGILIGTVALPALVWMIHRLKIADQGAPYLAGLCMMAFNVLYNFFGHRKFSFQGSGKSNS